MYETIVVGYDGSDFSKAALREAAAWVKRHGGKVVIVHGVYFDEEEFGVAPIQHEKRVEFGKKACIQAQSEIASEYGVEAETLVCEGEPPEVVVDVARGKDAGLIALGTYGRRGLKRLILGSVTSQVVMDAPCDVLSVRRMCNECTGRYESILVPFDGSQFSRKALDRACMLSKLDGGKVAVLYVVPRYEEMMEFLMTNSIRKNLLQEAEKLLDMAKKIAAAHGVSIITEIKEGPPSDRIIETASWNKSSVIVMGSHGWRGINKVLMGSTTERVIVTANSPVLIVR